MRLITALFTFILLFPAHILIAGEPDFDPFYTKGVELNSGPFMGKGSRHEKHTNALLIFIKSDKKRIGRDKYSLFTFSCRTLSLNKLARNSPIIDLVIVSLILFAGIKAGPQIENTSQSKLLAYKNISLLF